MKYFVIVDGYNTARLLPDLFKEKYQDSDYRRCIHVQSTPKVLSQMVMYDKEKYIANIVHSGDLDKTLQELKQYDIAAVVAGQEAGVEFADLLSEKLNMPTSNGSKKSAARRDKHEMRSAVAEAKLAVPKFKKFTDLDEILKWRKENTEFPVVLKALKSAGTDGVFICENEDQIKQAFSKIFQKINTMDQVNTAVLVEEFLDGKEYVVDSVSYQGKHYITDIFQYEKRYVPGAGFVYDKEYLLTFDDPVVAELTKYNAAMLDALEIKNGPAHAEIMVTKKGPVLVEVGARLNGVMHPRVHNTALGYNQGSLTVECYADPTHFLKIVSDFPRKPKQRIMIINLINEKSGTIEEINDKVLADMRNLPGVVNGELVLRVKTGQELAVTRTLPQAPIRFFMVHESLDQLNKDYETIQQLKAHLFKLKPKQSEVVIKAHTFSPPTIPSTGEKTPTKEPVESKRAVTL